MPRRTATDAEKLAEQVKNARWRYAIRHPDFRREIRDVGSLRQEEAGTLGVDWQGSYEALRTKWRFGEIPLGAFDAMVAPDPGDEVRLLEGFTKDVRAYPVMVGELNPGQRVVRLVVDLDNPPDLLVSLTERELRGLIREYRENPNQRRRFDKLDFYLDVFDRVERGETFPLVAHALRRSPSSVKSAFVAARRNVFGLLRDEESLLPSGKEIRLATFDKDTHMQRCGVCKAATTFDQLCPAARNYAGQDEATYLREQGGLDTVRDVRQDESTLP